MCLRLKSDDKSIIVQFTHFLSEGDTTDQVTSSADTVVKCFGSSYSGLRHPAQ